eukprot:10733384-Karenia_brevis.AAC.1
MKALLSVLVEVVQNKTTCFHPRSKSESAVDRFFLASQPWVVRQLLVRSYVSTSPFKMFHDKVSDHAIVKLVVSHVMRRRSAEQAIPSWVTKSSLYKSLLRNAIQSVGHELSSLPPLTRLP